MRSLLFGICAAIGLISAPVVAATVSETTSFSVRTTDWVRGISPNPSNSNTSILYGSEIFEPEIMQYDPNISRRLTVPTFDTGLAPFDWVHVSHDLTMRVETQGLSGSAGGFSVMLTFRGPVISEGRYSQNDFIATSGRIRSTGTYALSPAEAAAFNATSWNGLFHITGGAGSQRILNRPHDSFADQYNSNLLRLSRLDGTLWGSITVTAGYGGAPEPALQRSFVTVAPVPLPASGLLLGALLIAGAGVARTRRR